MWHCYLMRCEAIEFHLQSRFIIPCFFVHHNSRLYSIIQNNIKLLLFPANTSSQADAMVEMIICGVGYRNTVL